MMQTVPCTGAPEEGGEAAIQPTTLDKPRGISPEGCVSVRAAAGN